MSKLTKRQTEILAFIKSQIELTDAPPTRKEIAEHMDFKSPNAAEDHLRALARKGVIELIPGTSRGIRILTGTGVPVIGKVAAGSPILATENIEASYKLDPHLFHPSPNYFLKVCGDSMKNIGIHDGDLLAVHAVNEANNGQIVVARIEDEVTVKRFFRKTDNIVHLLPENDDYTPIEVDLSQQQLAIEGLAVGVIHQFQH